MLTTAHLHPLTVHFPIAIIAVGFLADLAGIFIRKEQCLSRMGFWLEILGMVSAIVAFGTGYYLTSPMEGEAGQVRDRHELFATITLVTIILATLFRIVINYQNKEGSSMKYVSLGLFFLAFLFVSVTGFLGGTLVIEYMIGL
jgi:uncharacterized membrane protein